MDKYVTVVYRKEAETKFIAVFHKIRSEIISDMIKSFDGRVDDNLTKKTDFLIVPNGFGDQHSSTSDKARSYGVPIVEIDNVQKYLEERYK